jgi:hypothetical protein
VYAVLCGMFLVYLCKQSSRWNCVFDRDGTSHTGDRVVATEQLGIGM